jgi:hypothetical protein
MHPPPIIFVMLSGLALTSLLLLATPWLAASHAQRAQRV